MTNSPLHIAVSHYSGCGNDFLLIDNRDGKTPELSCDTIKGLTSSAKVDGLIIANHSPSQDVAMRYYNSDGNEAEMCGNGARCLMQFLRQKGHYPRERCLVATKLREIMLTSHGQDVSVNMGKVDELGYNISLDSYTIHYLNTGVPHAVIFCENLEHVDVDSIGRLLRNHQYFAPSGVNVNFVTPILSQPHATAHIRTYERGVERETLACGTGVTAAAICLHRLYSFSSPISLQVKSGEWLQVFFEKQGNDLHNIILKGPAIWIRDGQIDLDPQSQSYHLHFHEARS